jgi:hypothetical protein
MVYYNMISHQQRAWMMIFNFFTKNSFKVGCYDMYLRYWRALTPQVITFDPEGVRAYVLHKTCQETPDLAEYAQQLQVCALT